MDNTPIKNSDFYKIPDSKGTATPATFKPDCFKNHRPPHFPWYIDGESGCLKPAFNGPVLRVVIQKNAAFIESIITECGVEMVLYPGRYQVLLKDLNFL